MTKGYAEPDERGRRLEDEAEDAFQRGEVELSESLLLRAARAGGRSESLDHNLGVVQAALGKHQEAIESFSRAMRYSPESVANRGYSYDAIGEPELAETDYLSALENDPSDVETLVNLGLLYISDDRWAQADLMLARAVSLDSSAEWQYSDVLIHNRRLLEARRALERTVAAGESRANLDLALLDIREGQSESAENHFLAAIEAGSSRGRVEYATFLLDHERTMEAIGVARAGAQLGDDWCYAPLAVGLNRIGRCDEASLYFREALRHWDWDYIRRMSIPGTDLDRQ